MLDVSLSGMERIELAGMRFGTLTAISFDSRVLYKSGRKVSRWLVECDCGVKKYVPTVALTQGRTKTCASAGCQFRVALRMKLMAGRNYVSGKQQVFTIYRRKATKSGREFTVTKEAFWRLIESNCHYCGVTPQNKSKRGPQKGVPYLYNGVDRIDSKGGYTADNVRPCCWICNRMKNVLTEAEFFEHVRKICEKMAGKGKQHEHRRPEV